MSDKTTYKSPNRVKKEQIVAELTEKIEKAEGIIFANYQGLTHQQLETLKKAVKKLDAEFVAAKNTLFLRVLESKLTDETKTHFKNPTAALFIYKDIIEPLKALTRMVKELNLPQIKFGLLSGKTISDKDVIKLSSLPALPILRAQFLGTMIAPISGLHRALSWNTTKLAMTIKAISDKKQATS